jgi:DNA-directed RNA polymerase subunit M/transcription elongation factor TFIIS
MLFCKSCHNMYYITLIDNGDVLQYYCRTCGDVYDGELTNEHKIVSRTTFQSSTPEFSTWVNEYTKFDPTLMRVNNIPCNNSKCVYNTNPGDTTHREIIVIRYDTINVKFLYLCPECDSVWTP